VTREELQEQLWGAHSLVDPELGLNTAIKKLRAAFGDQADNPRFIETIPRRGYRFLAPVRMLERNGLGDGPATLAPPLRGAEGEPLKPVPPVAHRRGRPTAFIRARICLNINNIPVHIQSIYNVLRSA
jgi:hypothetical protein